MNSSGTPEATAAPVLELDVWAVRIARGAGGRLLGIVAARVQFPSSPEVGTLTYRASRMTERALGLRGPHRFTTARWTRAGRGLTIRGVLVAPGETSATVRLLGFRLGVRGLEEALYLDGFGAAEAASLGAVWSE